MGRRKTKITKTVTQEEIENLILSLQVDEKSRDSIEIETRGQNDNKKWFDERKYRLTASNFFLCSRKPTKERVHELLYPYVVYTAGIEWGRENEDTAIQKYEHVTGDIVQKCGLFVCLDPELGFLGASPDGLVGIDKIIEVKCPYSGRKLAPLKIPENVKNFYCDRIAGRLILKRNHRYYYQIQGQLFITGRSLCDFVIWTEKGISIETITFDKKFMEKILPKLKNFYINGYAPEILKSMEVQFEKLRI